MTNNLLLIYPITLILISLWGCKISKKSEFADNMWDRNQSRMLQGIFCVAIVLHHLTQMATSYGQIYKGPVTILSSMGILFTSVFFFFSGYGLIYSYYNKKDYLEGFLIHRLPIILVPFFTANVIYLLTRIYYTHIPTTGSNIIKCLTGFILLNGNGWYMVEIFYFYLAFYFLFKYLKEKDIALILLGFVTIIIILIGLNSGHDYTDIGGHWFKGEWWYNSTIVFYMGALFGRFRIQIITYLKRHYQIILPLTIVLFIITFPIEEFILNTCGYYHESAVVDGINEKVITLIAQSILCLIFTLMILLINMKVTLNNKVIVLLSTISTELFLMHNLFLKSIFDFTHVKDFYTYAIVIVCGIIAAIVVHFINKPVIDLFHKLGKGKAYLKDCGEDLFRQRRDKNIKRLKIVIFSLLAITFVGVGIVTVFHNLIELPRQFNKEIENLRSASIGDEIEFGRYDTDYIIPGDEKLVWIVLYRNDTDILMVSKYGITASTYLNSHSDTNWSDSDLCDYLNNALYNQLFSNYEKEIILDNPDTKDKLSLLSVEEASEYFEGDFARQLAITSVAEKQGTNINNMSKVNYWDSKGYRSSWWWLRGDETKRNTAPIVTVDGIIIENEKYVNKPGGAIRPSVWIRLSE